MKKQINENGVQHRYLLAAGWTYEGQKRIFGNRHYDVKYWSHPDHGDFLRQVDAMRIQHVITPPALPGRPGPRGQRPATARG